MAAYLEFDLAKETEQLHQERDWTTGQNAKTLIKYEDLRVLLTALRDGARVPSHQTEGRISIHTVRGHIQVRAEGRTLICRLGDCLRSIDAPRLGHRLATRSHRARATRLMYYASVKVEGLGCLSRDQPA